MMTLRCNARPPLPMSACSFFNQISAGRPCTRGGDASLVPLFFNTMQPPMILPLNSIVICFYFIFMFGKRAQQCQRGDDAFLVPLLIYLMPLTMMPKPNSASLFSIFVLICPTTTTTSI
jgi:hypothetical protein